MFATYMATVYTDMIGNDVALEFPPKRIVSLVPSQTELLYDLGLDQEVVGITKFCVHPELWFRNKTRIGGTKTVHIDRVAALQPDLIIANKEENTKEQVEKLAGLYPTWVSDIHTIDEGLEMIKRVGALVDREDQANELAEQIENGFNNLGKAGRARRAAYFIWRKPWMCAGGDTFISNMIERLGWVNVLKDTARYPEVELDMLIDKGVDLVLLSSEPYPFKDQHIAEIKAILPNANVMLVDGEMFSWYGSRMLQASAYMADLLARIA